MPYTDRKYNLEVTEGLLFGQKRILTLIGRGGSVQGFGQPILGGHQPESEDPVFVWLLQSPNPYCMGICRVLGRGNCRSCKENSRGFCRTCRGFGRDICRGIGYSIECD